MNRGEVCSTVAQWGCYVGAVFHSDNHCYSSGSWQQQRLFMLASCILCHLYIRPAERQSSQ